MKHCFRYLHSISHNHLTGKLLLFGFIHLLCFNGFTQPMLKGLPLIRNFSTDEYQGGMQNWGFAQDGSDLLYVANNFGLLVYDGNLWSAIPIKEATRIISITYGPQNLIYIGGQGDFGYFETNTSGNLSYISLKQQLPTKYQNFNEVWKIHAIGEIVFFFTFDYIFKLENNNVEVIDFDTPLGLSFKVRNQLFVELPSQGVMHLSGGYIRPLKDAPKLVGKEIRGIVPFEMKKTLLATRDHGLFIMDGEDIKPWEIPYNDWLKEAQINTIKLLSSNLYAIGTQNLGLLILDKFGNVVHLLSEDVGLVNSTVLSLFEDNFGNLWAGLNNGISLIELEQPFTLINDDLGLPGTGYTAFKTDKFMYLGTNNGIFASDAQSTNGNIYPEYKKLISTNGRTHSLQKIDGDLILGHHRGIFLIEEQIAERLDNSLQGIWKALQLPTNEDLILTGSYTGMQLFEKKLGSWQLKKQFENFTESSRKYELLDSNTVWMSHGYKGVYKLQFSNNFNELKEVEFYGKEKGFPSNLLINVFRIENRLVFAAERGIYRYNQQEDRFAKDIELNKYFAEQHVRELEEDGLGNLYFITDQEIGVLKKSTNGDYEIETAAFQKILPFVSDDLENITIVDGENILINAKKGFVHYNPSQQLRPSPSFSSVFRQITWGDSLIFGGYSHSTIHADSLTKSSLIKLPYSKKPFHFHFASVYFEGTYQPKYQYWLENFETDWSEWSPSTEKEYTNLPAGKYTFHVRSINSFGKISETAQYNFRILPPWYLSKIAYAIYSVTALAFLALAIVMVDKRYKKKQINLIKSTNKTIREKESKLQEVTVSSEKAISQLKNESLKAELSHKNRELASAAMHLINKNELMHYLKLEINLLLKEDNKTTLDKGLKRIIKTIEKNIAEDEIWEQFELHFDQVHGDFIKKLRDKFPQLTPQEVKLSAFLRMNMSSKEIAHLLNISVRGVEISRYRLRKKLPLESKDNLVDFMMGVD